MTALTNDAQDSDRDEVEPGRMANQQRRTADDEGQHRELEEHEVAERGASSRHAVFVAHAG